MKTIEAPDIPESSFLVRVQTGISAAYWYDPAKPTYSKAKIATMTRAKTNQTAWFDELFEGGLMIPKVGSESPITILISGAPGTGKSTLASEICYRLARDGGPPGQQRLRSIYLSTEGHAPWTVEHMRAFGWAPNLFGEGEDSLVQVRSLKSSEDRRKLINHLDSMIHTGIEAPRETPDTSFQAIANFVIGIGQGIKDFHDKQPPTASSPLQSSLIESAPPGLTMREIMVFDNLNSNAPEADIWFPFVNVLSRKGFRVFIVIIDGGAYGGPGVALAKSWSYLADVVIQLGRRYPAGYLIHTIEVLKARYQRHVFGRHQMKLVAAARNSRASPRDHPYRREGGIFIFPSMHLALSRRKMEGSKANTKRLQTPFDPLNSLLGGGFFEGRCVALAGGRGTHKSRLAFAQVLKTLHDDPKSRSIIISLREEERTVASSLEDCLAPRLGDSPAPVSALVNSGRLELCYYPPGFISPDEFFHRVQLSVARQKKSAGDSPVLLVFNSLDLLHSHYPLCAEHSIFVPALVEMLCLEGVTSFIVATSEQNKDPYGLMSMADPVLRFRRFDKDAAGQGRIASGATMLQELLNQGQVVVQMTVDRFAAGSSAGSSLFLALLDDSGPNGKGLYGFTGTCTWPGSSEDR